MDRQFELGHHSKLAWEASRARTIPAAIDGFVVPASFLSELTADVNVLEVVQEVLILHPEDAINLLIGSVVEGSLGLLSPLFRVISPITSPLVSVVSFTVRISQHHQLLAHVVSHI